mgnify:CR=1 FL=1
MNLIDRLDKIDRKRESLHIYETRLRRLFFARALRDRQLARINRRWRALSDERAHILALITADPVLKQQFYDRERAHLTTIDNQEVMRRYLSVFGRSSSLRTAMSASDWNPRQLRSVPGTTIYLCIPDNELEAYAPILRLLFFMHMRILKDQPMPHGDPPITFFMDEMPQLGNFAAIPNTLFLR